MTLQERPDKFNQPHKKCQSVMSSIVTRPGTSKAIQHHRAAAPLTHARPPAFATKFSNDTARLQLINTIRKSTVGAQIKHVITLLFETRQAFTPEQINEKTYVDVNANKDVFDSLSNNIKVRYDGKYFSYKPKHELKDKEELLVLIRKFPEGMALIDLKDAYPTVMKDLQALKAAGYVWLLSNFDSRDGIVYPNEPKVPIKVDDELKQLFWQIDLPKDMIEIEKDLQKNGNKPATDTAQRRAQVHDIAPKSKPQKKERGISKRAKLTNAHIPELFNLTVPDS